MNSEHQADTIARSLAQFPPGTFKLFRRSRTRVEGTVEDHLQTCMRSEQGFNTPCNVAVCWKLFPCGCKLCISGSGFTL